FGPRHACSLTKSGCRFRAVKRVWNGPRTGSRKEPTKSRPPVTLAFQDAGAPDLSPHGWPSPPAAPLRAGGGPFRSGGISSYFSAARSKYAMCGRSFGSATDTRRVRAVANRAIRVAPAAPERTAGGHGRHQRPNRLCPWASNRWRLARGLENPF